MVIGIFGESCTGKTTLADKLKERMNAQVYTGRDYLRLEKNEADLVSICYICYNHYAPQISRCNSKRRNPYEKAVHRHPPG